MDSITIAWNKHSADEVQILSNRQSFQHDSREKRNQQENKFKKKKVHFKSVTPIVSHQAFENAEQNFSETNGTQRLSIEDHDYVSSSATNICTSQLSTIDNEPICSVRATFITFIIVVLIILTAAIAVGIVFSTIKISRNTTENVNPFTFSTVMPILSATMMTSSISIGSQSGVPCLSYTTINDPSRNVVQIGSSRSCDNGSLFRTSNDGALIRFVGIGGTRMALSSPGVNHCGGYITGWFNATLPTILGTMINGSVCLTADGDECFSFYESSVVYCDGSFYVYFLQPPIICNTRYCTE